MFPPNVSLFKNFLNSEIDSSARLMISVGGIVQQPNLQAGSDGFYISGGTNLTTDPIQINFFEAPAANEAFFGVAYGLSEVPSVCLLRDLKRLQAVL